MTLLRATVLDTPEVAPLGSMPLRSEEDAGLLVRDGRIAARGGFEELRREHPAEEVVDLRPGLLLPGFVDTHVHFPQARMIGALGLPLLDWLDLSALPEEVRLGDDGYAAGVAADFVRSLVAAGTTTALVFGSHFSAAVDLLLEEVRRVGLRVTTGLVVSDRGIPEPLLCTPQEAHDASLALAERWHGRDGIRYAVTPRFSYSASEAMLDACADVLRAVPGAWFTSHVNENPAEIAAVAGLFAQAEHYVDTYDRHGLVGRRSVLAHNVHPTHRELELLSGRDATVAHCPTSNAALGSGLFPLRQHLDHGVRVALGSDVGAGTGFSLLKEGLQAYFAQQLLGAEGLPLASPDLLHLATTAGAQALELDDVGHLGVGMQLDAVWVCPAPDSALAVCLRHADSAQDALARVFALGTTSDVAGVWVGGRRVVGGSSLDRER